MPKFCAFKVTRPTRAKVSLVASRPYESYTKKEREARLEHNPFSFLHIVNPGYKYKKEIAGKARFKLVKNRFLEFKEDGIFKTENQKVFLLHQIKYRNGDVFSGFVGCCHAEDYNENKIKKHEETLSKRVSLFTDYLKTVRFNTDPILLTYPKQNVLEELTNQITKSRAEYEFTTTSRETHYVWVISDQNQIDTIENSMSQVPHLYIADGHHRISSSVMLANEMALENKKHTGNEAYNYILSYLIPEKQLKIREFNRLVKDLNGLSKEEFLIKLDENFRIENRKQDYYKPSFKHHFSMYLDGEFYSLYLRKNSSSFKNALEGMDAYILNKYILDPILGIKDFKKSKRVAYVPAQKDMAYVKGKVDNQKYAVGFGMLPVNIQEVKQIADEGLSMPPKSTYIDPKLRSGVCIHEF
jgi:uncharacterized protein (DUF1015 family)